MNHLLSDILRILLFQSIAIAHLHIHKRPRYPQTYFPVVSRMLPLPHLKKNTFGLRRKKQKKPSRRRRRLLLRYGADVNHAVPSTDSGTVVQCSRCGRTQAAGNIKDNQYECTYCGNFTRHADASDSDHTGITALHAAVQKEGHLDVVVALLEHGADVDTVTAKVRVCVFDVCGCVYLCVERVC
jgi:hypothetical protein